MISFGGRSKLGPRSCTSWYLQLELPHDLGCRLAVPSVYVSRFHISGHWDPDALARWNLVMSYLGLVCRVAPPAAEITAGVQDWRWEAVVKLGLV